MASRDVAKKIDCSKKLTVSYLYGTGRSTGSLALASDSVVGGCVWGFDFLEALRHYLEWLLKRLGHNSSSNFGDFKSFFLEVQTIEIGEKVIAHETPLCSQGILHNMGVRFQTFLKMNYKL